MSVRTVGVNLLWLVPDDVGGSEESTVATFLAVAEQAPADLVVRPFVLEPMTRAHPELLEAFDCQVLPSNGASRARRMLAEATWLARQTRGLDLVHHAGGTAPARTPTPYVLTVHDLQPLELPGTHSAVKRAYLRAVLPRSIRGARRVVVPSDFVRGTVIDRFGVGPEHVVTVPHGVSVHPSPSPEADLRARYRLPGPVVLYPAITYPHKNHALLVAAFAQIASRHPDATLVLTGRDDRAGPALDEQIASLGLGGRVRRTGRIPAGDVAGLYRMADVVAVPSRYEGFGLPAMEALANGVPLVAAAATSLPEVVGDAGLLVDPDDVDGWAAALDELLALDPPARATSAERARDRAAGFLWAATARSLLGVYRDAR